MPISRSNVALLTHSERVIPNSFRTAHESGPENSKGSCISARPLKIFVEPWGIEPQTSRVRF